MDHRGLYGTLGEPTVGGIAAGNVSGPARINLGAARDSMIGVKFVNGRGEDIVSGGRVMKNVTGLDFVKALAGSHGTLAVFHEVCFKVLPLAEREATLVLEGLTDERAVEALSAALGSPFEPTGAAHLPAMGSTIARTVIRLEGVPASLAYRIDAMAKVWKPFGSFSVIESGASERLWRDVRDAAPVSAGDGAVWRLSVTPSKGPAIGATLKELGARVYYDWGGGLIWASIAQGNDAGAPQIHAAAKAAGGYATLMRAKDPLRLAVDVFDPPAGPLMTMHKKLKASFDPAGILNPGRMYSGI
jgi:glycolate oxidase FAD binding subunit